jgi:hypothetical protein
MSQFSTADIINLLKKNDKNIIIAQLTQEIMQLKAQLSQLDYKTIKNTQYERMNMELPYSWEELYAQAEDFRIQIRNKEQEIENLLKLN